MNKKISFLLIFFLLTAVSVFSQEDNASVESEEVAEERTDVIVETVELSETEEASADTEETSAEAAPEEEIVETPESEVTETAEQTAETSEIEEASADAEETSAEVASEEEPVETPESETSEVTEETAETSEGETASAETEQINIGEDEEIPEGIRNNKFYLESLRLTKLAHETFEYGDYDASAGFAEEAIRFAGLSDEYVAGELLTEAARLLAWADSNNIAEKFPNDYNDGKTSYEEGVAYHSEEEWIPSILASKKAIEIFDAFETGGTGTLPSQYTVRTWAKERDSLWTISGYPWVYSNPWKWRTLYEANKSKLPDPQNPDLIEPGMVLDIPSINDEVRQGMWSPPNN